MRHYVLPTYTCLSSKEYDQMSRNAIWESVAWHPANKTVAEETSNKRAFWVKPSGVEVTYDHTLLPCIQKNAWSQVRVGATSMVDNHWSYRLIQHSSRCCCKMVSIFLYRYSHSSVFSPQTNNLIAFEWLLNNNNNNNNNK